MKKYIGFLIVLSIFVLGGSKAQAAVNPNTTPCASTAAPSITVLSPNGGETYAVGQKIPVKWTSCNISSNQLLEINVYGGNITFGFLAPNGTPNDGQEIISTTEWSPAENYKIIVGVPINNDFSNSALSISDQSNNTFTIKASPEVAPTIKVLSPNGGETFNLGQKINVTWKTTGFSSNANVGIDLTQKIGGAYSEIRALSQTKNDGNEIITIPTDVSLGDNYIITVGLMEIGVSNQQIIDRSDLTFTIKNIPVTNGCVSASIPSLTIISPNGGETYNVGESMKMTWKTCNYGDNNLVKIGYDLITVNGSGAQNTFLMTNHDLLNDGSEIVFIPLNIPTANNYKIRMYTYDPANIMNGGGVYYRVDQSDNSFTVKNSSLVNDDIIENSGCSNGEKYSSTTGQMCTEYGCKHGEKYSSTTGQACPIVPEVVDKGCNGTIYSTTTGKRCGACSPSGAGCGNQNYTDTTPSISTTVSDIIAPITRILKVGVKGEDVKMVQSFLGIKADGSFGPVTAAKVKEWQASNDLKADGVFGPISIQKAGLAK